MLWECVSLRFKARNGMFDGLRDSVADAEERKKFMKLKSRGCDHWVKKGVLGPENE
jgi:hypothetical protein